MTMMMMTMMIFPMTMMMMMDPSKRRITLIQILLVTYEFISYSTGKTSIVFKDFEKIFKISSNLSRLRKYRI